MITKGEATSTSYVQIVCAGERQGLAYSPPTGQQNPRGLDMLWSGPDSVVHPLSSPRSTYSVFNRTLCPRRMRTRDILIARAVDYTIIPNPSLSLRYVNRRENMALPNRMFTVVLCGYLRDRYSVTRWS